MELIGKAEWDEALAAGREQRSATGFLPDVYKTSWPSLLDFFAFFSKIASPTADEIEEALPPHDPCDRVERALTASFIAHLAREAEADAPPRARFEMYALLRNYLAASTMPMETLLDVRWEIRAGLAARDLRRIIACCKRWLALDPEGATIEIAVDTAFAAIFRLPIYAEAFDAPPGLHDEQLPDARTNCHVIMFLWSTRIDPSAPLDPQSLVEVDLESSFLAGWSKERGLDWWSGLPADETTRDRIELLNVVLDMLRKLGPARVDGSPHLTALLAWCESTLGFLENRPDAVGRAAGRYARLSAPDAPDGQLRPIRAAADCYQYVGRLSDAEGQIRRWIAAAPDDGVAYRRLSEVLYKQEHIADAIAAFETSVRLKGDEQHDGWLESLTLRLGLESQLPRTIVLEAAAERAGWAPMGRRLSEWVHPWISHLCPDAQRRWWTGLYVLAAPEIRANLEEASVWETAADAFGEAVAIELRNSVFRPFREAHPREPSTTPLPDHWKRVKYGNATLGQLMHCLVGARPPLLPVGRTFSAWLQQHKTQLFGYICQREVDLLRLAKLRGSAQHNTVSQDEARFVFEAAAVLLKHIVSD